MSQTISQSLTIPTGLADGSTALAAHVTPLYQALNAFILPDTVGVFQQGLVDTVLYTVATGVTQDWAFSATKDKATMFLISLAWSGGASAPVYTLRVNAASTGAALTMTNAATGQGLIFGLIGGHDTTDTTMPVILLGMDNGAITTLRAASANVALPNVDTTSIGFLTGGTTVTTKFKYVKIWREG